VQMTQCGRICIGRRKISFSSVFAGQFVGVREVADDVWLVSFMDYDLGCLRQDKEPSRARWGEPLRSKRVTYVLGINNGPSPLIG
jgi:hypothetical protein